MYDGCVVSATPTDDELDLEGPTLRISPVVDTQYDIVCASS